MDAIDKYIDIVYNDKDISEEEIYNINYNILTNIILGLIKKDKYKQAEEIMSYVSLNIACPIKMRKYGWKNPSNDYWNPYLDRKDITLYSNALYTHMFLHRLDDRKYVMINYIRRDLEINNQHILKIIQKFYNMIGRVQEYHTTEELTPYLYNEIYQGKMVPFYWICKIYELRILRELNMNISYVSSIIIIIHIIMNYEDNINHIILGKQLKVLGFILRW